MLPQEDEESGAMEVPLHTAVRPIDASVASILRALLRTADFHKIRHGAGLIRRSFARLPRDPACMPSAACSLLACIFSSRQVASDAQRCQQLDSLTRFSAAASATQILPRLPAWRSGARTSDA